MAVRRSEAFKLARTLVHRAEAKIGLTRATVELAFSEGFIHTRHGVVEPSPALNQPGAAPNVFLQPSLTVAVSPGDEITLELVRLQRSLDSVRKLQRAGAVQHLAKSRGVTGA